MQPPAGPSPRRRVGPWVPVARWLPVALVALVAAGCGRRAPALRGPAPPANVRVGECADPSRDGVLGERPSLRRADRDLDGDRVDEVVVADTHLCSPEGNCAWNVFVRDAGADCHRYAGTLQAAAIERLPERGERGFFDLRGWWNLTGDGRMLMQHYRFRHGGYRVVDALLCRQEADRLLCAQEDR
jgi:hypothetical protein